MTQLHEETSEQVNTDRRIPHAVCIRCYPNAGPGMEMTALCGKVWTPVRMLGRGIVPEEGVCVVCYDLDICPNGHLQHTLKLKRG